MNAPVRDRKYAVGRVKHLLQRHSSPRLKMSMILFATALAGFFCSFYIIVCCRSLRDRRLFYTATFARSEFDWRSLSLNLFKARRA